MTIYRYLQPGIIDEITVKKTENGSVRAYLHARGGVAASQLADVSRTITQHGWQAIPTTQNGKPVLEVRGFMREEKLLDAAHEFGWIKGGAIITKDVVRETSFAEKLKKRSLQASGGFFMLGDAAYMTYGYKGSNVLNTLGGVAYGAGTLSLLGFGSKDKTDLQVRDISKHLSAYMKEHGSDLPKNCSLDEIGKDHKKGAIKSTQEFFRRYPSEMMNVFFAAAGLCIGLAAHNSLQEIKSAEALLKGGNGKFTKGFNADLDELFERRFPKATLPGGKNLKNPKYVELGKELVKHNRHEAYLDIGLGSMTASSGLLAAAVKEKAKDPDAPEKKGAAGLWEKIQHKPLAIAGYGYLVSTMCHAVSTGIAWKYAGAEKRRSVPFRAIFVVANIAAEILITISSKGHGSGVKGDKSVDDTVIALAAEAIATQPPRLQNVLIVNIGDFLGRNDVLAIKDKDVVDRLRMQVELMKNNPWAKCRSLAEPQEKENNLNALPNNSWQQHVRNDAPVAGPVGR